MTQAVAGVVFDLDGTLVDSRADIAIATNFALGFHGLPELPETTIAEFVGDGARNLIARAARIPHDAEALRPLLDTFVEYYSQHACGKTTLMPGACESLSALSGLPLAVLTNKPRRPTEAVLRGLGLEGYFRCVVAGGDLPWLKPDPAPLIELAKQLGTPTTELVVVGDGPQDIQCGRTAGAFTVGVLGGIAAERRLRDAGPDRVLRSLHELAALIDELRR